METNYEPGGPHDALAREVFEGEGIGQDNDSDRSSDSERRQSLTPPSSPPGSPPQNFAPRGPVKVRNRFRDKIPSHLRLDLHDLPNIAKNINFEDLHSAYETAVSSTSSSNEAQKFLEELKYLIISSQLCEQQPTFGPLSGAPLPVHAPQPEPEADIYSRPWTAEGAVAAGALGFGIACLIRWFFIGGVFTVSIKRTVVATVAVGAAVFSVRVYMRRQWLKYIHEQALVETKRFVQNASEFDSTVSAAVSFVVEVELIARGFRLSLPLPPVTRLENNGQALKCGKIRKALNDNFLLVIQAYYEAAQVIRDFANEDQLRGYEIAKQSNPDQVKAGMIRFMNVDPEEAMKTFLLRDSLALSRETRKMFLIGLISLESHGSKTDLLKLTTALEGIRKCNRVTQLACYQVKRILLADEGFKELGTPKTSQSPRHIRWKHQIQKVGAMNVNIRSLQAKLALLADESTTILNNASDISDLGPMFMSQYDNIGKDLQDLMEAWEAGKASLAANIDKNERRVSSTSVILSPSRATRLASVSEEGGGGVEEALRKLSGEASPPTETNSPILYPDDDAPMVFESIASARPKSMLSRAERIAKVHEERAARAAAKDAALDMGRFYGELTDVIKRRAPSYDNNRDGPLSPHPPIPLNFRQSSRMSLPADRGSSPL